MAFMGWSCLLCRNDTTVSRFFDLDGDSSNSTPDREGLSKSRPVMPRSSESCRFRPCTEEEDVPPNVPRPFKELEIYEGLRLCQTIAIM